MWRRGLLVCIGVAAALAGCGDDADSGGTPLTGADCRAGEKTLTRSLESSLAPRDAELKGLRTVKIEGGPEAPLTLLKKGAHVATGTLVAPGVERQTVSWVVSESMRKTGGGVAFALDPVTRKASALGSAAKPGSPIRDYAAAIRKSDAYEQGRACSQDSSKATSRAKATTKANSTAATSHAEFVERLNRLCRTTTAKLEKIDDRSFASKDPQVVAGAFDASVKQYDSALSKLEKLAVPDADRFAFDEYVASVKSSRRVAARIADNLRAAKKAGPLVQTLTEEKSKRLGAALDLGADDCG